MRAAKSSAMRGTPHALWARMVRGRGSSSAVRGERLAPIRGWPAAAAAPSPATPITAPSAGHTPPACPAGVPAPTIAAAPVTRWTSSSACTPAASTVTRRSPASGSITDWAPADQLDRRGTIPDRRFTERPTCGTQLQLPRGGPADQAPRLLPVPRSHRARRRAPRDPARPACQCIG